MSSPSTTRTAATPFARFGPTYGYRFVADTVEINASVQTLDDSAYPLHWVLQLQACPANCTSALTHAAHLVTEVLLPPIAEHAGAPEPYALTATATPPAGEAEFNLSLSLIARQPGKPDEIHDVARFVQPERFIQPRFTGTISCNFTQDEVRLALDAIENPRASDNVSGTLSLELWALTTPYTGGAFEGMPLAGAILGRLSGQQAWSCSSYSLHYAPPTAGQWNVALMLREWTGSGYTTRDYRNMDEPLVIVNPTAAKPTVEAKATPAPKKATAKASKPATKAPAAPKTKTAATGNKGRAKKSGK